MRIMRLVCFMSMCVSHSTVGNIIPAWAGINSSITSDNYFQSKLNDTVENVVNNLENTCQNYLADTNASHQTEPLDHHQSQEVSHRWSNGDHTVFISHSEHDEGEIIWFNMGANMYSEDDDIVNKHKTMAQKGLEQISETHPSGMAWIPAPTKTGRDRGYLFIASEEEGTVRIREFNKDHGHESIGTFVPIGVEDITDVWVLKRDYNTWVIVHDMNNAHGAAYRASTYELFQYGTVDEGNININALKYVNQYDSPKWTGCSKSLGQNAQVVQDSENSWYVVHSFTDSSACGDGLGNNVVKAYPASFDNEQFLVSTESTEAHEEEWVGYSASYDSRSADGASGFRVNKDGRLLAYFGAQFAHLSGGANYKTRLEECRSPKVP